MPINGCVGSQQVSLRKLAGCRDWFIERTTSLSLVCIVLFVGFPTFASSASIHWELERGFRFFKFGSDFALQRMAYLDFRARKANAEPTIVQLDAQLDDLDWWYKPIHPNVAAWYGHSSPVSPIVILQQWRAEEISKGRAPGYLELSLKLKSQGLYDWEYHPVRLGWASHLFPSHQSPTDIGRSNLIDSARVAVCWSRAAQRHNNCDNDDPYVVPRQHRVALRAVDLSGKRELTGSCQWILPDRMAGAILLPENIASNQVTVPCARNVVVSIEFGKEAVVRLIRDSVESKPVKIRIDDVLIVGLGDSFSSGEGNPDVPVKLAWESLGTRDPIASREPAYDTTTQGPVRKRAGDYFAAQWIDRSCHRSAYSYQLRSALHLAVADPQRAITFLSYSCSGAEINEGLLFPFQGPEYSTNKAKMPAWQRAQIPLLLSEICESYDGRGLRNSPFSRNEEQQALRNGRYKLGSAVSERALGCASNNTQAKPAFKRQIDLLYVSIGGNDLGFSRWIAAAITREGLFGSFLPAIGSAQDKKCSGRPQSCVESKLRLEALQARLGVLKQVVKNKLAISQDSGPRVLLYAYPLPIRDHSGQLCPAGNAGLTVFATQQITPNVSRFCVNAKLRGLLTLETIRDFANKHLNQQLDTFADDKGAAWKFVDGYLDKFENRGYCASRVHELSGGKAPEEPAKGCLTASQARIAARLVATGAAGGQESLHLPVTGTGGSEWLPFDPIRHYRPYRHRARLLRTMNETHFLINQQGAKSQAIRASGALSLKDAAVFGAFHPTAEAHAIIADRFSKESAAALSLPNVRHQRP